MLGRHPDDRGDGLAKIRAHRRSLSNNKSAAGGGNPETVGPKTGHISLGETSPRHRAAAKPRSYRRQKS